MSVVANKFLQIYTDMGCTLRKQFVYLYQINELPSKFVVIFQIIHS